MTPEDPLADWLLTLPTETIPSERIAQIQAELRAGLDELNAFLNEPASRRVDLRDVSRKLFWGRHSFVGFTPEDLPRACETYRRVFAREMSGSVDVQAMLLNLIAASENAALVPFWLDTLTLYRQRDVFRPQRQTIALAALARLAIRQNEPEAYEALRQGAAHREPGVRGLAIHYLGRAYREAGRPLPPSLLVELKDIALQDAFFEPRFQARMLLQTAEVAVPFDNRGGTYSFRVKPLWTKRIYRTIEMRSEQTLDDLQRFIQHAFEWNNEHLYSFYMNGCKYDDRFAFACPHEGDRPACTVEAVIGELGLVLHHSFLYHFDYAADHLFEVEVVNIRPDVRPGNYPRLVDSYGKAPRQYPSL